MIDENPTSGQTAPQARLPRDQVPPSRAVHAPMAIRLSAAWCTLEK
jgi:hypothetical protein